VAISVILMAVGLPAEAIGLLLVVDRILDMTRTAVNVFSDSVGAVVIARSEGELNLLKSIESLNEKKDSSQA
jgi:DAACS family dicarboxylate/amino acid:cation (Na+ or H+) symporter